MSRLTDYFEDQSEADQIIDEATDKLIGLISEATKADIERYKNWYESANKMRAELQKQTYEQQEKINALEIDLKRAKEELERKDNEIPKVPFMPGEKIWWIGNDCRNSTSITCHMCEGKGKVKAQTTEYGEVEITCPHCKGRSLVAYEPAKAYPGYVIRSLVYLDAQENSPSFSYDLVQDEHEYSDYSNNVEYGKPIFGRDKIYKTEEEAKEAADKETEERRAKAEKSLIGK